MPLPTIVADNLTRVTPRRIRRPGRSGAVPVEIMAVAEAAEGPIAPADATGWSLPVRVERQAMEEWCWAAVGLALARYHETDAGALSQCAFASEVFGRDCCAGPELCNDPRVFEDVLPRAGLSARFGTDYINGPISFERVIHHIDRFRPVAVNIRWLNRAGFHLVLVFGYETANDSEWVFIYDPLSGPDGAPAVGHVAFQYAGLRDAYVREDEAGTAVGTWDFSFFPRKAAPA